MSFPFWKTETDPLLDPKFPSAEINVRSFESFVNLPLGERSAVRISAYDLHTGGWLDNVATTQDFTYLGTHSNADYIDLREDYNSSDKSGYRVRFATETENGITFDLSFCHRF